MPNHVLLDRLKEIYDALNQYHNKNGELEDDNALISLNSWSGILEEDRTIPDYYFILNLCYGPWVEERQIKVWKIVYVQFKEKCKGDLRNLTDSINLGFPFKWQEERAKKLARYLREKRLGFADLLQKIKEKDGLVIRDGFKRVLGAHATKTVSTFIRDLLRKDVFPIDVRVEKMLSNLGLPSNEDVMVVLCRKVGINPRVFNRMLYKNGELCNAAKCRECPVSDHCYMNIYTKIVSGFM